ncbi:MAG: (Fe-S)-binding protein [Mogibacterium sp.]|nr:(Fe-S)-binding protein [Mogibacterium sp.]
MISVESCIHCHKCRKSCAFLSKYMIDICDTEKLKELAYHCFLCGKCTAVCPVGIDGRQLIMEFRRERSLTDERASIEKKNRSLIREKKDYIYRNWKHVTAGTVFFPGCNFPSMYPKTNAALAKLFEKYGIGTVYECCGKPIGELGFADDEEKIISGIRKRMKNAGVTEIVTACPNCMAFFGDRLGIRVRSVYDKLNEIGEGNILTGDMEFYLPCPDRSDHKWIEEIKKFIDGTVTVNDSAECCGLGGSAIRLEKEIADGFVEKLRESTERNLFTYCASCVGRFRRSGLRTSDHVLPLIMGIDEQPDIMKSYINRVFTKIK